jgi:predicted DNA-binding transcriptional regulator YafY
MTPRRKDAAGPAGNATAATVATAAAQLRRLLLALPALSDGRAHPLTEVAGRVGTDVATLRRDLSTLVTRVGDEPGGFTESVQLLLWADAVQLQTPGGHFRRPMALTRTELQALELGLAALQQESPPDEHDAIVRARARLQKAIAQGPVNGAGPPPLDRHAVLGEEGADARATRRTLQLCIRERRVARISYRGAQSDTDGERRVQPLGVVWARGAWYLVAWCERNDGIRVFRCDRITTADATEERFAPPSAFSLESVLRDGRVLVGESDAVMRVRYSPRVARWIAERERVTVEPDGSVVAEYPLLDVDWGVRLALRYGPDAEVLAPPEVREGVAARLRPTA